MSILDDILKVKKNEVLNLRSNYSLNSFGESEFFNLPARSLRASLLRPDRLGIIAEIKKASPSKGILNHNFDHLKIANLYMENDVDAISVLTDTNFFRGNITYLKEIAGFKTLPLLRKDFIIDEYQIFEAKAGGADAVLLIAEALSKDQIAELTGAAAECKLEVLLEIHSFSQLDKINFTANNLIGINNRNLDTFEVNLSASIELSEIIPENVLLVSESGINSLGDIRSILGTKIKAVLTGEHFMRSGNIPETIGEFKKWCMYES